ncbi:hypothetical protein [Rickettsia bellii]|uniref:Uncharacterized protein n=1 Tax=Rickettsia bellii str. RML Mogi TaxID=1359194 RepID=A0A0F3QJJ2_RICBE|nr:hypothetical protein [Rickettsia bellii]KJV92326.1 hypothetical protein RBEMOGI_0954 [Rickettsia bellii str. RML Mogi]
MFCLSSNTLFVCGPTGFLLIVLVPKLTILFATNPRTFGSANNLNAGTITPPYSRLLILSAILINSGACLPASSTNFLPSNFSFCPIGFVSKNSCTTGPNLSACVVNRLGISFSIILFISGLLFFISIKVLSNAFNSSFFLLLEVT